MIRVRLTAGSVAASNGITTTVTITITGGTAAVTADGITATVTASLTAGAASGA